MKRLLCGFCFAFVMLFVLGIGAVRAAPSLPVTKPPIASPVLSGPALDPVATGGQWFVASEIEERRTHEFHDNVIGAGGGNASHGAITGYVSRINYESLPPHAIVGFEITATIINDTASREGQWVSGTNSHGEVGTRVEQDYVGILIKPKLVVEFAILEELVPDRFEPPYLNPYDGMSDIAAVNADQFAWYCWSPEAPGVTPGEYYVPTWDFPDIDVGRSATRVLQFSCTGQGIGVGDPRYAFLGTAAETRSDVFLNRSTSLKISNWIDVLSNDDGLPYPDVTALLGSNVSVFHNVEEPENAIEIDSFPTSVLELVIFDAAGGAETLAVTGTSVMHVFFEGTREGDADDDDGNNREEVETEIVSMSLTGSSSQGPVTVRLWPAMPTLGEMEETRNSLTNILDVAPFNPGIGGGGNFNVDSFFDVFVEIEIDGGGPVRHNDAPVRVAGIFTHKPPAAGESVEADPTGLPVALLDPAGAPTGETLSIARFTPNFRPPEDELDWGDAPDPAYPTLALSTGAYHIIGGPWFGDANDGPDGEQDGQPDAIAMGDDNDGNDDEDGITIPTLTVGQSTIITVVVSGGGVVDAWIDYDRDGVWSPAEKVVNGYVAAGTNYFAVIPPAGSVIGQTFARFRISTRGHLMATGGAMDGEVEDLEVFIEAEEPPSDAKWEQPPDLSIEGMDVHCTFPRVLADDFECMQTGPITNITIWGSWSNDLLPSVGHEIPDPSLVRFTLSFHSDIPAAGGEHSRPGDVLWMTNMVPGTYAVRAWASDLVEGWHDPMTGVYIPEGDHVCWMYQFPIDMENAFVQFGTPDSPMVYWLDVQAEVLGDNGALFGWKSSIMHWNDDATWGDGPEPYTEPWFELVYPAGHPLETNSVDLAFALYGGDGEEPPEALDWGDAPDPTYPTLNASTGAYHVIKPGLYLGWLVDAEPDGQPDPQALGDDQNPPHPPPSDEDGVVVTAPIYSGGIGYIDVIASGSAGGAGGMAFLNAWVDFNSNGWWDAPEQIFTNLVLAAGTNSLTFGVPYVPAGRRFARFRYSTQRGLWPTGGAPDGEVEDYELVIEEEVPDELDWGDAPDRPYPTLATSTGAYHVIGGPWLGDLTDAPDGESDGQQDSGAMGDDNDGNDDEDGVQIPTLIVGQSVNITVQVNGGGGEVVGWIDFDGDGWWQAGEQVFSGYLSDGMHSIPVTAPVRSVVGQTFARFRISRQAGLWPTGGASEGEVEDHEVFIEAEEPPRIGKWEQRPDLSVDGMDVDCTFPNILADDFECMQTGPITNVVVWGSWFHDELPPQGPAGITFTLSIHADIPATNGHYSMPGETLWFRDFAAGAYRAEIEAEFLQEGWYDPAQEYYEWPGDSNCWRYTFPIDITNAFVQLGETNRPVVYWLNVRAEAMDGRSFFGWKSSPDHWNDDAVWGNEPIPEPYPGPWIEMIYPERHPLHSNSVDLAFAIYSGEEEPPEDELDWGDAPDGLGGSSYPTVASSTGAYHVIGGAWLGNMGDRPDKEPDGQPDTLAQGDDLNGVNDENGVSRPLDLVQGLTSNLVVMVNGGGGVLWAWIDWNGDGKWDATDKVFGGFLTNGVHTIPVTAPAGSIIGTTFARFRISSLGTLPPTGGAPDGEVEDYELRIKEPPVRYDFGDADNTYGTLLVSTGAFHQIVPGVYLGSGVDWDADGQPDGTATGDDNDGNDDEDGVSLSRPMYVGTVAQATITASTGGYVTAWIDFDGNGSWVEPGDRIISALPMTAGVNYVSFNVPSNAVPGGPQARFRFCTNRVVLPYTGSFPNGEVEDYEVLLLDRDFGDAPASYGTLSLNNGAYHARRAQPILGHRIDAEFDGQPTVGATGDDANGVDDEDGLIFAGDWVRGSNAVLRFSSNGTNGYLNVWVDYNVDGDWLDAGEQILTNVLLQGNLDVTNGVPAAASIGRTYLRARLSTQTGLWHGGFALDGEVEDYALTLYQVGPSVASNVVISNVAVTVGNDETTIRWRAENGVIYQLQSASNLTASPVIWNDVNGLITGPVDRVTHSNATGNVLYYRLLVPNVAP